MSNINYSPNSFAPPRPDWHHYHMGFAHRAARRASCPRRAVGAVLVTPDNRLLAAGYNGAPSGWEDCLTSGCHMVNGHCERAVHAEANVIITAARHGLSTQGTTLYISGASPCQRCALLIAQAGITRVVHRLDYTTPDGVDLLKSHGVVVTRLE